MRAWPRLPLIRADDAPAREVQFAAVAVTPEERISAAPSSLIEMEFADGTRLRITGSAEAATVSALMKVLTQNRRRR